MNYGWLLGLLGDSSIASQSSDPGGSVGLSNSWALRTFFVHTIQILSSHLPLCPRLGSCCTLAVALGKVFHSVFWS